MIHHPLRRAMYLSGYKPHGVSRAISVVGPGASSPCSRPVPGPPSSTRVSDGRCSPQDGGVRSQTSTGPPRIQFIQLVVQVHPNTYSCAIPVNPKYTDARGSQGSDREAPELVHGEFPMTSSRPRPTYRGTRAVTSPRVMATAHENAAGPQTARAGAGISRRVSASYCWARHGERDVLASRAERAGVAREPGHDAAQLVRPPDPAERVQARPLVEQVRLCVEVRCGHAAEASQRVSPRSQTSTARRRTGAQRHADPTRRGAKHDRARTRRGTSGRARAAPVRGHERESGTGGDRGRTLCRCGPG